MRLRPRVYERLMGVPHGSDVGGRDGIFKDGEPLGRKLGGSETFAQIDVPASVGTPAGGIFRPATTRGGGESLSLMMTKVIKIAFV